LPGGGVCVDMTDDFLSTEALVEALSAAEFDRPPAFVMNAHITGLGVARALSADGVPVVALDRADEGADAVAPPSDAVAHAGAVTYPLDDRDGFRADLEALADAAGAEPVAFGCMDEWVHGLAESRPDGVRLPFAADRIGGVLDKFALYDRAEALGVPYPETYRLDEHDPGEAAEALGFPLIVKPARKRAGEAVLGSNVVEVGDEAEFRDVVARAREADVGVMAQEKIRAVPGRDHSLASYAPESGDPLAIVGNARVHYPLSFGTSCLVERARKPEIRERALAVIEDAGYRGISESEFVYDADREEFVLLDINTRPWKWIDLPVTAGANLPLAAYADAVGADRERAGPTGDGDGIGDRAARWVYLRDYLALLSERPSFEDALSAAGWRALLSETFEDDGALTTAVYRPSDPGPAARLVETEFGDADYYCPC